LTPDEHALAAGLAEKAQAEGLVLFIGAGVSRDVNLPDGTVIPEGTGLCHP
jgi:hypothetical protein